VQLNIVLIIAYHWPFRLLFSTVKTGRWFSHHFDSVPMFSIQTGLNLDWRISFPPEFSNQVKLRLNLLNGPISNWFWKSPAEPWQYSRESASSIGL